MRNRRAVYESMSRGDLIDALCNVDTSPVFRQEAAALQTELDRARTGLNVLESSREYFATLFEDCPIAYCVLDAACAFVEANRATCALLGRTRAALIGTSFSRVVEVCERPLLEEHVARCLRDGSRVTSQIRVRCTGRERTVLLTSQLAGGHVGRCRTVLVDVTAMKEIEGLAQRFAACCEALVGVRPPSRAAEALAHSCVPCLADACFVDLFAADGADMERVVVLTDDEGASGALWEHAENQEWRVLASRIGSTLTPVFEPTTAAMLGPRLEREVSATGLMIVPLVCDARALGVIGLVTMKSARPYALSDLELARAVARVGAKAISAARARPRLPVGRASTR